MLQLHDLDLGGNAPFSHRFPAGGITVVVGPNNSGKTQLARRIAGLQRSPPGTVFIDGVDVSALGARKRRVGLVYQAFVNYPNWSLFRNIASPLIAAGAARKRIEEQVHELAERLRIGDLLERMPHELSGGQQQRVGIARSLAVEPDVWLLDEPFSALDPLIRKQMQDEFLRIQSKLHKSIVFITHDFQEALRIADRMAIMRDGAIVQIGRPVDLILNPADDYVREFTCDVPWERILRAADIADSTAVETRGLDRVAEDALVESLLPRLASAPNGVAVEAADGAVIGIATARSFAAALATGSGTGIVARES